MLTGLQFAQLRDKFELLLAHRDRRQLHDNLWLRRDDPTPGHYAIRLTGIGGPATLLSLGDLKIRLHAVPSYHTTTPFMEGKDTVIQEHLRGLGLQYSTFIHNTYYIVKLTLPNGNWYPIRSGSIITLRFNAEA